MGDSLVNFSYYKYNIILEQKSDKYQKKVKLNLHQVQLLFDFLVLHTPLEYLKTAKSNEQLIKEDKLKLNN